MKDPCRNQSRDYTKVSARIHEKSPVPNWAEAVAQHSIVTSAATPASTPAAAILGDESMLAAPDVHLEKIG
jgi:hypothetical protein